MVLEFPRPTYPGDFVSCNLYVSPDAFATVDFDADDDLEARTFELTLPHDGLTRDMLYEIIFGPFSFLITADPGQGLLGMTITAPDPGDPEEQIVLLSQAYQQTYILDIVPAVHAYFAPRVYTEDIVLPPGEITVQFNYSGAPGTYAQLYYASPYFSCVFGIRPCDQTNNDTFRIIQAEGVDLPYVP